MSDIAGNPHYEGLARFNGRDLSVPEISYMEAQATLALVWEQRTANLLSAFEISLRAQSAGFNVDAKTIDARLGLNKKED